MPRLVHLGEDICHRVAVLRRAGYEVDVCISTVRLRDCLLRSSETAAILITDQSGEIPDEVLRLIHDCSSSPVVLFRSSNNDYSNAWFDLVIPVLSRPDEWLHDIARITECRASQGAIARC